MQDPGEATGESQQKNGDKALVTQLLQGLAKSRYLAACRTKGRHLIAEVVVLKRNLQIRLAQHGDHALQVITLLAGYPKFVTLDGGLHFQLGVLDHFDQFAGHIGINTLLNGDFHTGFFACLDNIAFLHALDIDIALDEFVFQDIQHLLNLKIGLRCQGDLRVIQLKTGVHTFEVKACADLPAGLVDGIAHFRQIHFRNHIKRWHNNLCIHDKQDNAAYTITMSLPVHIPPHSAVHTGWPHWHILGAGAMGCLWASVMQRDAPEQLTTLILRDRQTVTDYPGTIELQQAHGSILRTQHPATCPDELIESGALISNLLLTCKAVDVLPALRSVKRCLAPTAQVVLLQNGLRPHLQSRELFPDLALYAMSLSHGAWLRQAYRAVHAGVGECWLGPLTDSAQQHAALLDELPARAMNIHWQAQILPRLWQKFAVNCAINGLTVIYDSPNGQLLDNPAAHQHLENLCAEIENILTDLPHAYPVADLLAEVTGVLQQTAANISSTLQDVRRGRPTEIAEFNGYLCELAETAGLACPLNRRVYEQVMAQLSC